VLSLRTSDGESLYRSMKSSRHSGIVSPRICVQVARHREMSSVEALMRCHSRPRYCRSLLNLREISENPGRSARHPEMKPLASSSRKVRSHP